MHSFKSKWDVLHYYSILHARCKKYAAWGADKKLGVVDLTKSVYVVPYPRPCLSSCSMSSTGVGTSWLCAWRICVQKFWECGSLVSCLHMGELIFPLSCAQKRVQSAAMQQNFALSQSWGKFPAGVAAVRKIIIFYSFCVKETLVSFICSSRSVRWGNIINKIQVECSNICFKTVPHLVIFIFLNGWALVMKVCCISVYT